MLRWALFLLGALAAWPASAQPEEIEVAADQAYAHTASGMSFPPAIGPLTRDSIRKFSGENDLGAVYIRADRRVWATIYLTRVGTPDLSLWFDRVRGLVFAREGFHPAPGAGLEAVPFTASGFNRASGLKLTYPIASGGEVSATGIALAAYGTYLVKVRISTDRLTEAELAAEFDTLLSSMPAPKSLGNEAAPYILSACLDALQFDKKAKQRKVDVGEGLLYALMAGGVGEVVDEEGEPSTAVPIPTYCRDPSSTQALAIYRPAASTSGYLISYDDTGSAVVVGGGGASILDILSGAEDPKRKKTPSYAVIHQTPDGNTVYRPFTTLPTPEAVIKVPGNQSPVSRSDRDNNLEITTQ